MRVVCLKFTGKQVFVFQAVLNRLMKIVATNTRDPKFECSDLR